MAALRRKVAATSFRIIHMRMIKGLEIERIAEKVGLSPADVRVELDRMTRKLQIGLALFTGEPLGARRKQ